MECLLQSCRSIAKGAGFLCLPRSEPGVKRRKVPHVDSMRRGALGRRSSATTAQGWWERVPTSRYQRCSKRSFGSHEDMRCRQSGYIESPRDHQSERRFYQAKVSPPQRAVAGLFRLTRWPRYSRYAHSETGFKLEEPARVCFDARALAIP